jgi:hypothetical protein
MESSNTTSYVLTQRSIQEELDYVKEKEARGAARRYLQAKEDSDEILLCYRRVHTLLQRLSVSRAYSKTEMMYFYLL